MSREECPDSERFGNHALGERVEEIGKDKKRRRISPFLKVK